MITLILGEQERVVLDKARCAMRKHATAEIGQAIIFDNLFLKKSAVQRFWCSGKKFGVEEPQAQSLAWKFRFVFHPPCLSHPFRLLSLP